MANSKGRLNQNLRVSSTRVITTITLSGCKEDVGEARVKSRLALGFRPQACASARSTMTQELVNDSRKAPHAPSCRWQTHRQQFSVKSIPPSGLSPCFQMFTSRELELTKFGTVRCWCCRYGRSERVKRDDGAQRRGQVTNVELSVVIPVRMSDGCRITDICQKEKSSLVVACCCRRRYRCNRYLARDSLRVNRVFVALKIETLMLF